MSSRLTAARIPAMIVLGVAVALAMSACGSDDPERPQVVTAAPAPDGPAREEVPFARDGVSLTVRQTGTKCGEGGAYKAKVAWKYPAGLAESVSVTVGDPPGTLFAASKKADDSADTGVWVVEGMEFRLADQATSEVLAAVQAGAGKC